MMRLVARDWRFRYPAQERWALDRITVAIHPGQVTWLTGALGSGTSTLLLSLAGLAPRLTGGDADGVIEHDDAAENGRSPLEVGIGYLGATPSLQLSGIAATVRDEVAVGPMNRGWPAPTIVRTAAVALERLHIDHLAKRAPGKLSGGETQRVLLAGLLASAPKAWLLDEPFSALDHASVTHVQQLMGDVARAGASVVIACDDADIMLPIADRMIVMQRGRVALDDTPRRLLAGDDIIVCGAGTTDAAELARRAGAALPRPLTRPELLVRIGAAPMARLPATPPLIEQRGKALLAMEAVSFHYPHGVPVLQDVHLRLRAGEAVGVFGANGAGKSTLLRLAMALEHPTAGTVTTLGRSTAMRFPEDFSPKAGFLFQQPERQLFGSSVAVECGLAPRLSGWDDRRIAAAVSETLDQLGLSDTATEHPYDLPVPTRRLVALAAVLAADPELLLLDEPTAGLDANSRDRVINVIRRRVRNGRGVLAITHDAQFAHEALDRGILLENGKVAHDGSLRDIIDDRRMLRPAAMTAAMAVGLPPGSDRRDEVATQLRTRMPSQTTTIPLTALLGAALFQVRGDALAEPTATQAVLALLADAGRAGVRLEASADGLLIDDRRVAPGAPGGDVVRQALLNLHTSRLTLPASLDVTQWERVIELYASAPGLYDSVDDVRDALRASVPEVIVSGVGPVDAETDLRDALFELPGLRAVSGDLAPAAAADPREAEMTALETQLDPIIARAEAAGQHADFVQLANVLLELVRFEHASNHDLRPIVARERRRVVRPSMLEEMAHAMTRSGNPPLLARALTAIGRDGADALIIALNQVTRATDRRIYIDALVDCRDCDEAIIAALSGTRPQLNRDAAEIAGRKRLERAVPMLSQLLKHQQTDVRTSAWHALELIGTREARRALGN